MSARSTQAALRVFVLVATALGVWLTATRLQLSSDLTPLFPNRGDAAALARYARVFSRTELDLVLVRGDDPDDVRAAAEDLARSLRARPSVSLVIDRAPQPEMPDPTLAWVYAGPDAQARLAAALTPDGMRERLATTRSLLLAPGASEAEEWLARDPLRLAQIPWESRREIAAGLSAGDGGFATTDGRARIVAAQARGSAFDADAAAAFVDDAEAAIAEARRAHPKASFDLTGGHAIARATERVIRRDMEVSSTLSMLLASAAFLLTFRRARALLAVLPPLVLGTLWTTGLAAFFPHGISVLAIAFAAVVVGVGVDTGVHVYAALLDARRRGLSPHAAALEARRATWRPTLIAALVAALAFASLALSQLTALGQLGLLCGAGELLTSIAILLVTPEIGAWLERKPPPPARGLGWLAIVARLTATKRRAATALAVACGAIAVLVVVGLPRASDALVAIRPRGIAPLSTQEEVYRLFGGKPGQWVVLSIDRDASAARARSDAIADALDALHETGDIEGYDALTTFDPSPREVARRVAARDALDLPARARDLATALAAEGFDAEACAPALDALAHPATPRAPDAKHDPALDFIRSRHVASDEGETLVATYVRSTGDPAADARALAAIRAADPTAVVTGYTHLERALRASLAHDLPIIALVALAVAAIALRASFRRARDVFLALFVLVSELAALFLVMRALDVRWHVYDALVVPALIGITLDESMFLLYADAHDADALTSQGALVSATALTTASGFAALLVCRYPGLVDLGAVGAIGVVLGLVAALVVVPAGIRLTTETQR